MKLVRAALGLGSNLGDRRSNLQRGLKLLFTSPSTNLEAVSCVYETPPWGVEEQPAFLNAAVIVNTTLTPRALLNLCLQTESSLGRVRQIHWGSRSLDIDILLYGQQVINATDLVVPHPWLAQRLFVLIPLAEIAADWQHPVLGNSIYDLLQRLRRDQEETFEQIKQLGRLL